MIWPVILFTEPGIVLEFALGDACFHLVTIEIIGEDLFAVQPVFDVFSAHDDALTGSILPAGLSGLSAAGGSTS